VRRGSRRAAICARVRPKTSTQPGASMRARTRLTRGT
jgi:hypothetical protein